MSKMFLSADSSYLQFCGLKVGDATIISSGSDFQKKTDDTLLDNSNKKDKLYSKP